MASSQLADSDNFFSIKPEPTARHDFADHDQVRQLTLESIVAFYSRRRSLV